MRFDRNLALGCFSVCGWWVYHDNGVVCGEALAMVKAVLFDLDGTLLDTLGDLADAVNWALGSLGVPGRTEDEVRAFVGNGVGLLIRRALPEGRGELVEECLARFKARYAAHMEDRTRVYPGVLGMLDGLRERGVLCAVISNKFDGAVGPLCEKYFGDKLAAALGEREGVPRKPAPEGCFLLMERLGVRADEVFYVGDSETDVETARNAGLRCVGVTWGFRSRETLIGAGADVVVDDVDELMRVLVG